MIPKAISYITNTLCLIIYIYSTALQVSLRLTLTTDNAQLAWKPLNINILSMLLCTVVNPCCKQTTFSLVPQIITWVINSNQHPWTLTIIQNRYNFRIINFILALNIIRIWNLFNLTHNCTAYLNEHKEIIDIAMDSPPYISFALNHNAQHCRTWYKVGIPFNEIHNSTCRV